MNNQQEPPYDPRKGTLLDWDGEVPGWDKPVAPPHDFSKVPVLDWADIQKAMDSPETQRILNSLPRSRPLAPRELPIHRDKLEGYPYGPWPKNTGQQQNKLISPELLNEIHAEFCPPKLTFWQKFTRKLQAFWRHLFN